MLAFLLLEPLGLGDSHIPTSGFLLYSTQSSVLPAVLDCFAREEFRVSGIGLEGLRI